MKDIKAKLLAAAMAANAISAAAWFAEAQQSRNLCSRWLHGLNSIIDNVCTVGLTEQVLHERRRCFSARLSQG
jgi:hypothetical protein